MGINDTLRGQMHSFICKENELSSLLMSTFLIIVIQFSHLKNPLTTQKKKEKKEIKLNANN